jgi:hypothetical protein
MPVPVIASVLAVLLTCAALWRREVVWLRRATAIYLLSVAIFYGVFGFSNVARFGMIDDVALLRSQVKYAAAYRDGLLAAQDVAFRYIPTGLVLYLCLALLAWFPAERSRKQSGSD